MAALRQSRQSNNTDANPSPTVEDTPTDLNTVLGIPTDVYVKVSTGQVDQHKYHIQIARPIHPDNFGIQTDESSLTDFQSTFPNTNYKIIDTPIFWTMPSVSKIEPKEFTKETNEIIRTITGRLERIFSEKIRDQDLIPFSIYMLMKVFLESGLANYNLVKDESLQDVFLYRGIFSGLQLSCTSRQLQLILPKCYHIMFSQEIMDPLTKSYPTLDTLLTYLESIPSVSTSPLYKTFLLKQTSQLPNLAMKYSEANIMTSILEYHSRLIELSRKTSIGTSITILMAISKTAPQVSDRIQDYLGSRNASAEASQIEIDEELSKFQEAKKIVLSTEKLSLVRRAELKLLITEHFESINYLLQTLYKADAKKESNPQIAAYKPEQRRQANTTTTSTSLCPHRENHSNCSVKQLNSQDWIKGIANLYYYARLLTRLRKNCTLDQSTSTVDNLITEGHFGRTKSMAFEVSGVNNPDLNKFQGRNKRPRTDNLSRNQKPQGNDQSTTVPPTNDQQEQFATNFQKGSL